MEVLVAANGAVSCSGPGDPHPETTLTWLASVDRSTGMEPGTVRAALVSLAQRVFADPDFVAAVAEH